jgi:alpha-tubulin suppressor-like RCC1 family protein
MSIKDIVSIRNRLDQLLVLKECEHQQLSPMRKQLSQSIDSALSASNAHESISLILSQAGLIVVLGRELPAFDFPPNPNAHSLDAAKQKVELGQIKIRVEGQDGLTSGTYMKATSEQGRVVVSLGRCIQLSDQALSNGAAIQLAEATFARILALVASTSVLFQRAATVALFDQERPPESTRLILDVQERRVQEVVIRLASGVQNGTRFGTGATLTARGRVRLLLRQPRNVGSPLNIGSEPLEEIGAFLCTNTSCWPVMGSECDLGFIEPTASTPPLPEWDSTTFAWDPKSVGNAQDLEVVEGNLVLDVDDDAIVWADAQGGQGLEETFSGGRGVVAATRVPSATMELLCWGDNEYGELSEYAETTAQVHHSVLPVPGQLGWSALAPWEQVRMVATSARHTVLATTVGSVYTCGDGSDGALGHGDTHGERSLRIVLWFAEGHDETEDQASKTPTRRSARDSHDHPEIVAVGAGADLFGSHSAALDTKGRVYTWGIGSACGRGNRKPAPEPGKVVFEGDLLKESNGDNSGSEVGRDDETCVEVRVGSIACGGGYCAAVTTAGELWCWGNYMGGRLGLGPVPSKVEASYMHGNSRKRLLPLLLRPKRVIRGLEGVVLEQVSCGDAHTCVRSTSGGLFVWGQNESGQLGLGPSLRSGQLETELWPVPQPRFTGRHASTKATFVACGAAHTMVIDGTGDVWSWGACGGACLGHPVDNPANTTSSSGSSGGDANRMAGGGGGRARHTFRATSELQAARAVRQRAQEATAEAPSWSIPRRVDALCGANAVGGAAGERHTVVLLRSGQVAMCGDGMALVRQFTRDDAKNSEVELPSAAAESEQNAEKMADALAALGDTEPVVMPRVPCGAWFPLLEGKFITSVACGGQHTIVASRGEEIGLTLGFALLTSLKRVKLKGGSTRAEEEEEEDSEDEGVGLLRQLDSGPACYDCVLLTAGSALAAHRFVLARRSRVLRELIAQEERPNAHNKVLELLLPDLRHDTALALREYLYTDTVSVRTLRGPGSSLPYDLFDAATRYELPRLAAICANALPLSALGSGDHANGAIRRAPVVPSSTLVSDFGGALGDSTWADVKFIAGGRAIFAHKAVLSAASEYFSLMLRHSGGGNGGRDVKREEGEEDEEEDEDARSNLIEVVVPDSHVGMLRLLIFIYTGHIEGIGADYDSSVLLEDLIAADRFQLLSMKRECHHRDI